jgi:YVTN family beta-propeller protein
MKRIFFRAVWIVVFLVSMCVPSEHDAKAQTNGDTSYAIYVVNTHSNDVSVINSVSKEKITTIAIGNNPVAIAFTPDGRYAYVPYYPDKLAVIDTAVNIVINRITIGMYPGYLTMSPDGTNVYVTNQGSDSVSVIDTTTNQSIEPPILVGDNPCGIDITPNGRFLYVGNYLSASISVIDLQTKSISAVIMGVNYPHVLRIAPDGTKAYVSSYSDHSVSKIDIASNSVERIIMVGNDPIEMALTPDSHTLYVTNFGSNTISVIDTIGNTVTDTIDVGQAPDDAAVSPDGMFVYIANAFSNTISVIEVLNKQVVQTFSAYGDNPAGIAFLVNHQSHQAPVTTIDFSPQLNSEGKIYEPVSITFTASASVGYTVSQINYTLDNGPEQVYSSPIIVNSVGTHTINYQAVDNAGIEELAVSQSFTILAADTVAPTTIIRINPATPNGTQDWYISNVHLEVVANDNAEGTGIAETRCIIDPSAVPQILDDIPVGCTFINEGAQFAIDGIHQVYAGSFDRAQNIENPLVIKSLKIDQSLPVIIPKVSPEYPASTGWYNIATGAPTVSFTCSDSVSGIQPGSCPAPHPFLDGDHQSYSASVYDKAGNVSDPAEVSGIRVDLTPPMLNPTISPNPILLGGSATVVPGGSDLGSGVAYQGCSAIDTSSVGAKSISCVAIDSAGNQTSKIVNYRVIYAFEGFLQPINDTAHQTCTGCATSIFNGNSTIPVKFQLKDAYGNIVQASSTPIWIIPQQGGPTTAPIDEGFYSDPATTGNIYAFNGDHYQYNWKTKGYATGFYWRIGVKLDDGQVYSVYIGLR